MINELLINYSIFIKNFEIKTRRLKTAKNKKPPRSGRLSKLKFISFLFTLFLLVPIDIHFDYRIPVTFFFAGDFDINGLL